MMKKAVILLESVIAAVIMLMSMSISSAYAIDAGSAAGYTLGENGVEACELFNIPDNNIIITDSIDSLRNALSTAGDRAAVSSDVFLVYMVPGSYSAARPITVPENVVLAGEDDTVLTHTGTSPSYMVRVCGSIYGGTFIGNPQISNKSGRVLLFNDQEFTSPNGIVQNTHVSKAGWSGIEARGTSTRGCQVIGNTVKDCGGNGVRSIGGSTIALIEGNDISGSGQAGIDITSGNVGTIKDNNIHNVTGHGISTDTEQEFNTPGKPGYGCKRECDITDVINNTITNTGTHGIYLEENCHIKGTMDGNKVGKCGKCALGAHPKSTIKMMENNELYGATLSVFGMSGKVTMGSGNIIRNGKAAGIALNKGGKLYIKGKNNKIYKNKNNGIQLVESAYLSITGKRNYIYSNSWGIGIAKKCKATIKYAKIYGNKKGAIYCRKGSSFTKSKCSIKGKVYKQK